MPSKKFEGSTGVQGYVGRTKMIGYFIIATTLLTRGVNNIQEAVVLAVSPPAALANYTYHYLEHINFNYTHLAQTILSMPEKFSMADWITRPQFYSMKNTTDYWMNEIPTMATELPKQLYERMLPPQPRYTSSQLDLGMVFLGMYLLSLFTLAAAIWMLNPSATRTYEDIDSDNILVRKRKRSQMPMNFYDSNRMLLRSETSEDDVFYKLD